MSDVERRLDKVEEALDKMSENQTRTNVLLEQVMDWVRTERSNTLRVSILETNWRWARGLMGMLIVPMIFLLIKTFI